MRLALAMLLTAGMIAGCATSQHVRPTAGPYDETAEGEVLVAGALERAQATDRRVLLVFGANWCADCRAMDTLFKTHDAIARQLQEHFVVVKLDVGRDEAPRKNARLIERFAAAVETGIPVLVVTDAGGRPLNDTRHERLADTDHRDPDRVLEFLRQWSR